MKGCHVVPSVCQHSGAGWVVVQASDPHQTGDPHQADDPHHSPRSNLFQCRITSLSLKEKFYKKTKRKRKKRLASVALVCFMPSSHFRALIFFLFQCLHVVLGLWHGFRRLLFCEFSSPCTHTSWSLTVQLQKHVNVLFKNTIML